MMRVVRAGAYKGTKNEAIKPNIISISNRIISSKPKIFDKKLRII